MVDFFPIARADFSLPPSSYSPYLCLRPPSSIISLVPPSLTSSIDKLFANSSLCFFLFFSSSSSFSSFSPIFQEQCTTPFYSSAHITTLFHLHLHLSPVTFRLSPIPPPPLHSSTPHHTIQTDNQTGLHHPHTSLSIYLQPQRFFLFLLNPAFPPVSFPFRFLSFPKKRAPSFTPLYFSFNSSSHSLYFSAYLYCHPPSTYLHLLNPYFILLTPEEAKEAREAREIYREIEKRGA